MLGRRLPTWAGFLVALAGLGWLSADALRAGFLNDDYLFLEEARRVPLLRSLGTLGALGNWYRPLSRQVWFEALTAVGGDPLLFHLASFAVFAAALVLLWDLLSALLPRPGAMAGTLWFALLPLVRVDLTWISAGQDLLALAFTLAAVALFRRRRDAWAALCWLLALLSKESALPLPAVLVFWATAIDGLPPARAARRLAPFAAAALVWIVVWRAAGAPGRGATGMTGLSASNVPAAYLHLAQSLLGIEHPAGFVDALWRNGPDPFALVLLGALALWLPATARQREPESVVSPHRTVVLGLAWLIAFGIATIPVVAIWSGYFYTLAAVGGALIVGTLLRRAGPAAWVGLVAGLLWWHAAGTGVRAFAVTPNAWGGTSHLTSFYFRRAAALTDTLRRQLRALEPAPPHDTRFFFATLPPWAGFQMGNGALVRALYRDTTLASHFYSEFSESTAAGYPVRFLYWDGRALAPLYPGARDPFFQVGSDLLLFGRPRGAAHAFARGLAAGENPIDHWYWLGWARLWNGDRGGAEAAWSSFGARDDSLLALATLGEARRQLLGRGDTLMARRYLASSIRYGIGRPIPHAVLGPLLMPARPKYGMLELTVASRLNPRDWLSRRDLFVGLVDARLDEPARRELEILERTYPRWDADTALVAARRRLERRSPDRAGAITF